MDKITNVSSISDCYGCGVCAAVCPKNIIHIRLNKDGFYQPYIDEEDKCTHCSLCLKVCSYVQEDISTPRKVLSSYASWSKDESVRRKSSSGGTGFEIARYLIEQGYNAVGVKYNAELNRAEHYVATCVEELIQSMGSKYIQSYTVHAFKKLDKKNRYLITGTPCQIDSFRRYIRQRKIEDKYVLMDFFCHGVPSKWMWNKYLSEVSKNVGKVEAVSWRNKHTGWHHSYILRISGSKGEYSSRYSQGDAFFRLFLSDNCLGKACYDKCKYKYNSSSADIRIGDLWGKKYRANEEGVTGVVVFTEKGEEILKQCKCSLISEPLDIVAEGQMKTPAQRGRVYDRITSLIHNRHSSIHQLSTIVNKDLKRKRNLSRLRHPLQTLFNIIKRIIRK